MGTGSGGGSAVISTDNTVTNNGTAPVYPTLIIWNEAGTEAETLSYLKNETTGVTLWMDYTLAIEEKITIDFNPNHFKCESSYFGDVSEMILGGSDTNFYLMPGVNIINCMTKDNGVTASLYWRKAHWTADGVAA